MRNFLLATVCLFTVASAAVAQSDRKSEFFVGFSLLGAEVVFDRADPNRLFNKDIFDQRSTSGFEGSGAGFFNDSGFGVKGDFSFHLRDRSMDVTGGSDRIRTDIIFFLGGPTYKFRRGKRLEPFVHALLGGAHTRFKVTTTRTPAGSTVTNSAESSSNDFAAAFGGGLDIHLGGRLSLRAIQVEYAPIFRRDHTINLPGTGGVAQPVTLAGQRQDNMRISFGIVF